MKNIKLIVSLILFSLVLAACASKSAATASDPQPTQVASSVVAEGHLLPIQSTDLAFESAGRVAEVLVKAGDTVTSGQTLARLEVINEELKQADLARAQQAVLNAQQAVNDLQSGAGLQLAQAQKNVADDQKLLDDARKSLDKARADGEVLVVAQAEAQVNVLQEKLANDQSYAEQLQVSGVDAARLQFAQAQLTAAQAALVSAQAALKPVELQAPWTGSVAEVNLVVGQSVTPGTPVISLADYSSWVVKTDDLTELKVAYVKVGQQVALTFDALPDANLTGTIVSISPKYIEQRGDITYTATIALDAVDPAVRWGMTASIRFTK